MKRRDPRVAVLALALAIPVCACRSAPIIPPPDPIDPATLSPALPFQA